MTDKQRDKFERELRSLRLALLRATKNLRCRYPMSPRSSELAEMSESEQRAYKELRATYDSLAREYRTLLNQEPPVVVVNLDGISTAELKERLAKPGDAE